MMVEKRSFESGEDIKKWREANDYDQAMLALELGVTRQTVGNWERRSKQEGVPTYLQIALIALEKYPEFRKVRR
jgi:DNA-binding XRE family transcriptional regulator